MFSVLSKSLKLNGIANNIANLSTTAFKVLAVTVPKKHVYHVKLNRPEKRNAFNHAMWLEIKQCFDELSDDEDCRAVVLSGEGKLFCAGIDLSDLLAQGQAVAEKDDIARKAKLIYKRIEAYQASITSLEACKKPVLAAIHSACVGAGAALITAADIRYCTKDAWFSVKEVDVGLAADVGTLQRLPKVIGSDSLVRELCFTARKIAADEALSSGLVSRVFETQEELLRGAIKVAEEISRKSPVAVQTTKANLIFSRGHSVQEGLDHIKYWNQLMLQSEDLVLAATGALTKDDNIEFQNL